VRISKEDRNSMICRKVVVGNAYPLGAVSSHIGALIEFIYLKTLVSSLSCFSLGPHSVSNL